MFILRLPTFLAYCILYVAFGVEQGVNYKVDVPVNSNGFSCMGTDVIQKAETTSAY
ncbi:hypothetical protein LINPERPRIM_LOCUS25001 [Linum perenne]